MVLFQFSLAPPCLVSIFLPALLLLRSLCLFQLLLILHFLLSKYFLPLRYAAWSQLQPVNRFRGTKVLPQPQHVPVCFVKDHPKTYQTDIAYNAHRTQNTTPTENQEHNGHNDSKVVCCVPQNN